MPRYPRLICTKPAKAPKTPPATMRVSSSCDGGIRKDAKVNLASKMLLKAGLLEDRVQ